MNSLPRAGLRRITLASSYKCLQFVVGVSLVVLTESEFRISLFISQLMAKAIPVRGAKFKKPA